MGTRKCCVGGCNATSGSHRLFRLPKNDDLRNLWLSFLVPTNSLLIGLTTEQLLNKRVCEKHFDKHQFGREGRRLRYSYPCLFTNEELAHGVVLSKSGWDVTLEHNYYKKQDEEDVTDLSSSEATMTEYSVSCEHNYSKVPDVTDITKSSVTTSVDMAMDQQSDSRVVYDAEIGTKTVEPVKRIKTHKKKRSTVKKIESRQSKFFQHVTQIAADSSSNSASQLLSQATSFASSNIQLLEKFKLLNKQAQTFLLMQLKQVQKSKMARRFTLEEKLMALLLIKQSPKGYKLLEKMFALPNKRTLMRLSEKVSLEPGLNPQIFDHITRVCKNWDTNKKLCTLVFDEVALTPHLTFNEKKEKIIGFVDIAGIRKFQYADHALVFMVRGICSPWRQSIAYYFCAGTVSAVDLKNILIQMVSQVALTGLIPLGLVCDQGSTFRTAIRKLREETIKTRNLQDVQDDGSVNIGEHALSIFYDPPHLLKGVRNNFLNKDIIWEGQTATWRDIEFIYDIDSKLGHTRALPKLTAHHIDPKKIKKMKVSVATQVLSARTSAMLKYTNALVNLRSAETTNTMATTAKVVEFFDKLFDSVNGSPGGNKRGKLRKAIKNDSIHQSFWYDAIKKIKEMNYIDKNSKLAVQLGTPRFVKVPSLQGWITTLESFIRVSKLLFDRYAVDFFYPRYINQDPLENFFGRIRALNYRNVNPDANTFIYAFKSLMLNNAISPHSKFANCEEDNGENLVNIRILFDNKSVNKENSTNSLHFSSQSCPREKFSMDQVILEKIKVHCSAYTAGYVCRKMSQKLKCKACLHTYTSKEVQNIHNYIQFREYTSLKNNNLYYPSEKLLIAYRDMASLIHSFLNNNCYKDHLKINLTNQILNTMRFSWLGCENHQDTIVNILISTIIRLQGHNLCNIINKIFKGDIEEKYILKMGEPQRRALLKCKSFKLRKNK